MSGSTESLSSIENRVRSTIEKTFRISNSPEPGYSMGSVPGWDSLGHMELIMELEKEFGITLPSYSFAELINVEAISRIIRENQ